MNGETGELTDKELEELEERNKAYVSKTLVHEYFEDVYKAPAEGEERILLTYTELSSLVPSEIKIGKAHIKEALMKMGVKTEKSIRKNSPQTGRTVLYSIHCKDANVSRRILDTYPYAFNELKEPEEPKE